MQEAAHAAAQGHWTRSGLWGPPGAPRAWRTGSPSQAMAGPSEATHSTPPGRRAPVRGAQQPQWTWGKGGGTQGQGQESPSEHPGARSLVSEPFLGAGVPTCMAWKASGKESPSGTPGNPAWSQSLPWELAAPTCMGPGRPSAGQTQTPSPRSHWGSCGCSSPHSRSPARLVAPGSS